VARAGFPTTCVSAAGLISKPTLCPKGDLPQLVAVTLVDDAGAPMPGVPRDQIVATRTCRLLATAARDRRPLAANGAPTTWVGTIATGADTSAQGDHDRSRRDRRLSDLRIVARGSSWRFSRFAIDFLPRTGLTADSSSVSASESDSVVNSIGRTDRD
jgi:hypothetical protein